MNTCIVHVQLGQTCYEVRAGDWHSYARSEGNLWAWGKHHLLISNNQNNNKNELNQSISTLNEEITRVSLQVQRISTGKQHTYVWKDNTVYSWGSNHNYQLGQDKEENYNLHKVQLFQQAFEAGFRLKSISCGEQHTLAIFQEDEIEQNKWRTETRLFGWGQSKSGQLTLDTSDIVPYPVISQCNLYNIESIYSRSDYNIVICTKGQIYSWGCNMFNRLGLNYLKNDSNRTTDHQNNLQPTKIIKIRLPQQIKLNCKIKKIGIGLYHIMAIGFYGQLYSWGNGLHGQLGIGKFLVQSMPTKVDVEDAVLDVSCGQQHSVLILVNGKVMSCGSNISGALGHQQHNQKDLKKRCETFKVIKLQPNFQGKQISCGAKHTLLLSSNGKVYSWGDNNYNQVIPLKNIYKTIQKQQYQPKQYQNKYKQRIIQINQKQIKKQLLNNNQYNKKSQQKIIKIKQWKIKYQQFLKNKNKEQQIFLLQLNKILNQNNY